MTRRPGTAGGVDTHEVAEELTPARFAAVRLSAVPAPGSGRPER